MLFIKNNTPEKSRILRGTMLSENEFPPRTFINRGDNTYPKINIRKPQKIASLIEEPSNKE